MNSQRFLILLLISLSIFFLSSSTSDAALLKCPKIPPPSDSEQVQIVVILKPPNLLGAVLDLVDHLLLLVQCLGRKIEKLVPGEGLFGNGPLNLNVITDLSIIGTGFRIYTGSFERNFINDVLKKRNDIQVLEELIPVKADSVIPPVVLKKRNLEKRTTQSSAPPNLDRIDQKNFPLDKKYNYPSGAGSVANVYVVDTGIATKNVEFEGRASHGGTFCGNCSSTDDHGHGTNVAGIIGGKKFGVSKKTKLIAVKVLNDKGQGSSATVTAGLSFVISKHKKDSNKNTIVNLSFSSSVSQAINDMVKQCVSAGIHVVVSAGDKSGDACNSSPSSVSQAIRVGATESSSNNVASFSNFGNCVDIFAPGRDIKAAGASNDNNAVSVSSGTSQSCPHVAGTIALIMTKKGNMKPATMKDALLTLSVKNILKKGTNPNVFLQIPAP